MGNPVRVSRVPHIHILPLTGTPARRQFPVLQLNIMHAAALLPEQQVRNRKTHPFTRTGWRKQQQVLETIRNIIFAGFILPQQHPFLGKQPGLFNFRRRRPVCIPMHRFFFLKGSKIHQRRPEQEQLPPNGQQCPNRWAYQLHVHINLQLPGILQPIAHQCLIGLPQIRWVTNKCPGIFRGRHHSRSQHPRIGRNTHNHRDRHGQQQAVIKIGTIA